MGLLEFTCVTGRGQKRTNDCLSSDDFGCRATLVTSREPRLSLSMFLANKSGWLHAEVLVLKADVSLFNSAVRSLNQPDICHWYCERRPAYFWYHI